MLKITELFDVTKDDSCDVDFVDVPVMTPPDPNSDDFEKDLDAVIFHYNNPCLNTQFLNLSHNSVKDVYKNYCREIGLRLDWKSISKMLDEVESVVSKLKKQYARPRPKIFLTEKSSKFDDVKNMKSYSFPSGHTAIAYFLSEVLSDHFPDDRSGFENIAALIGQSRIENAVHFPSDVLYGRLLGEFLFSNFSENQNEINLHKQRSRKQNKKFADYLISKNSDVQETINNIGSFLYITNLIERKSTSLDDCRSAAKMLLSSVTDHALSENPDLRSQCAALRESFYIKNYSPSGIVRIHKQFDPSILDRGEPGEIRSYAHRSPTGIEYSDPELINNCLGMISDCSDPLIRHYLYEWIHPFCDGNGRSGRILLVQDMDYDFREVNNILLQDYIAKMDNFFHENDIRLFFN